MYKAFNMHLISFNPHHRSNSSYYYTYFTMRKLRFREWGTSTKVTWQVSGRIRIQISICPDSRTHILFPTTT